MIRTAFLPCAGNNCGTPLAVRIRAREVDGSVHCTVTDHPGRCRHCGTDFTGHFPEPTHGELYAAWAEGEPV